MLVCKTLTTSEYDLADSPFPFADVPFLRSLDPPPSSPTCPITLVPPDILSHILLRCSGGNYKVDKSTYTKLCLVNRQFFFPAREHLYRNLTIFIRSKFSKIYLEKMEKAERRQYRRDLRILGTVQKVESIGILVKELSLSFETLPPSRSEALRLHQLLSHLPNLEKFWLLDDGTGFWGRDKSGHDTGSLETVLSLVNLRRLRVLAIPQMRLDSVYTQLVFSKLPALDIYKGTVFSQPSDKDYFIDYNPKTATSVSALSRAYITHFASPEDLAFIFRPSLDSLRFFHLVLRLENGIVDLSSLHVLQSLTITTRLVDHGSFDSGGRVTAGMEPREMGARMEEIPNELLANVFGTLESVKYTSSLTSFCLLNELTMLLEESKLAVPLFRSLPRSLTELALGPMAVPHYPWSRFLRNRRLYPSLRKLYLTPTPLSDSDPLSSSEAYFGGVRDLKATAGIEVEWVKGFYGWRRWSGREFNPEGTDEEASGKRNKLTMDAITNPTCIVS